MSVLQNIITSSMVVVLNYLKIHTVNPVLLAAAAVVCSRNEDENAKVGVRL